jgi:hypothetical protein
LERLKGDSLAVLEYHTSGSFNNSDGTGRIGYYNVTGVPYSKLDGRRTVSGGGASTFGSFLSNYNWEANLYYSACTLQVAVNYDSTSRLLKVKTWTTALDTFPSANLHLRYAIAESHIYYPWQTLDSLHHVVRKMLPSYTGVAFSIQPGETFVDSQSYVLPSAWVDKNCYVVVFAQADGYGDRAVFCSERAEVFQTYTVGDVNGDGKIDVADAVFLLNYLFKQGPVPNPLGRGDANGDGQVQVGDAIYLLNYLFKGGPAPF